LATSNSFGNSLSQQFPLVDPRRLRDARVRFRRGEIQELDYANSIWVQNGKWPARGWLLMRRKHFNQINTYSDSLVLVVADVQTNTSMTFQNLTVVQARCVSRGVAADPEAVYLVEITDKQGVVYNQWFQYPTTSQYNIRAPAYPEQFYTPSLNAGMPWTWTSLIQDLWNQMTAILGPYPGLPFVPAGTPEGFAFPGQSAWEALNHALDLLGCTVSSDLRQAAPYGIVQYGAADANVAALQAKYAGVLEDDLEYLDTGSGRVPGQVTVYFHVRYQYYGTEETVRSDVFQWSSFPLYPVTVAGPAPFNAAVGTAFLWDDFTVKLDINGMPLAADVATAQTIAAERTTQFYGRIHRATLGALDQTYTGALPFVTGGQVDGVSWRQDYERAGWRTRIIRGPYPAFPELIRPPMEF
jgi:hypothetical protein